MPSTYLALLTLLLWPLALGQAQEASPRSSRIHWESNWETAFKQARAQKKPLWIAIMMAKEKGCRMVQRQVFEDPRVIAKSRSFICLPSCKDWMEEKSFLVDGKQVSSNPYFPGVSSKACLSIEAKMRKSYQTEERVIAPQQLLVAPGGQLLLRREYALSAEAMLKLMDRALRKLGRKETTAAKKATPRSREAGRAPAAKGEASAPVLSANAQRLLAVVQAGPLEVRLDAAQELLTDGGDARAAQARALALLLKGKQVGTRKMRAAIIRAVGGPKFSAGAPAFTLLLNQPDSFLRNCAAVTLEEMASPTVAAALLARFKLEKDRNVRKDIIQALGPCGAGHSAALTFLKKQLKSRDSLFRTAAAMALASHLKQQEIQKLLLARYRKESGKGLAKTAILWAFFTSREPSLVEELAKLAKKERNGTYKEMLGRVMAGLAGKPYKSKLGGHGRKRGHARGLRRLYKFFLPLYAHDRVERKLIKTLKQRFGRRNRRGS